jgi:hypothetical protein
VPSNQPRAGEGAIPRLYTTGAMRTSENTYLLRSLVALANAPELPCSARCFPRALPCEQPLEVQLSGAIAHYGVET